MNPTDIGRLLIGAGIVIAVIAGVVLTRACRGP